MVALLKVNCFATEQEMSKWKYWNNFLSLNPSKIKKNKCAHDEFAKSLEPQSRHKGVKFIFPS